MDAARVGYGRLADFMVWDPSLAIFPRFRSANVLCLLQLQAEITDIEEQLQDLATAYKACDSITRKAWLYDFSKLKATGKDTPQDQLFRKLRLLLAEYSMSLWFWLSWKPFFSCYRAASDTKPLS